MKGYVIAAVAAILAGQASAEDMKKPGAAATLSDPEGDALGEVKLWETSHGLLVRAELENLKPGTYAFHIHETGKCKPDFKAAGGHFNPTGVEHGFLNEKGYHRGDMPNITVPASGDLTHEVFLPNLTLQAGKGHTLLDRDGAAAMLHSGADDYRTDPAGDAGTRIGCGVIEAK